MKIDNLIFSINTDAAVRAQKLKAGECQITLNPRPADLKALQEAANLKVPSQPGFNLGYIAYNVTMLDIFVIAILVALVNFGNLASIEANLGAAAFASVVVLTMLAAVTFDPRLIWDNTNLDDENE